MKTARTQARHVPHHFVVTYISVTFTVLVLMVSCSSSDSVRVEDGTVTRIDGGRTSEPKEGQGTSELSDGVVTVEPQEGEGTSEPDLIYCDGDVVISTQDDDPDKWGSSINGQTYDTAEEYSAALSEAVKCESQDHTEVATQMPADGATCEESLVLSIEEVDGGEEVWYLEDASGGELAGPGTEDEIMVAMQAFCGT